MKKIKLLAPVNSYDSAVMQIDAGADELFVGVKSSDYERYSFSGRGQIGRNKIQSVPDFEELRNIISFAHQRNVEVNLTANVPMFSDFKGKDYEKHYVEQVCKAVDYEVDHLIIGDIGLMSIISELNLPVNIHASTYFDTLSVAQLEFLRSLNVKRAVLSYQCDFKEVQKLCAANIMEIEVFGYLSCSFYNGACNLVHDMGEDDSQDKTSIGVPCKAQYHVNLPGGEHECAYLDADLPCGLCAVKKLQEAGVDVVKIAGRDRDSNKIANVTRMFRKAIDLANQDTSDFESLVKELPNVWWKRLYCRKNRCKYSVNDVTKSYIGIEK